MIKKYLYIILTLLLLILVPLEINISQSIKYDVSGWVEVFEPTINASFKCPPQWKKITTGDGVYFNPDRPMVDNQGRTITPMITVSNVEDEKEVENYLKNINSGVFELRSTKYYDYYVGTVIWRNIQRMYIYIEVVKGKRYIGCCLYPHSSDPASRRFEIDFLSMAQTFRFEKSEHDKINSKTSDDKIKSHWKVD